MNIDKLFSDKKYLDSQIDFFIDKKQIKKIESNTQLVKAHIMKAKHNIAFFKVNKKFKEYADWLIVVLYYALYHSALALIVNKHYSSKNHQATILILIKEYSISKEEAELINKLSINKEDAELYTNLKEDRHSASYSTGTKFTENLIEYYERAVIRFINKVEDIINNE